jgi:hypothetical protein
MCNAVDLSKGLRVRFSATEQAYPRHQHSVGSAARLCSRCCRALDVLAEATHPLSWTEGPAAKRFNGRVVG